MLEIYSVVLRNFCQHNGAFTFRNGLNVVLGPNGSGKSNLLAGIYYALLGRFPNRTKQSFIQFNKDGFEVKLYFAYNGESYSIERFSEEAAKLFRASDQSVVQGTQEVNNMLASLGLTESLLKRIFILQGEMDAFLAKSSANRIQYLMDIVTDLPLFEKVWKEIGTVADGIQLYATIKAPSKRVLQRCRDKIAHFNKVLVKVETRLKQWNDLFNNSVDEEYIENIQNEKARLSASIEENQQQLQQLRAQLDDVNNQLNKLLAHSDLEVIQLRIKAKLQTISEQKALEKQIKQEYEDIVSKFKSRPKVYKHLEDRLASLELSIGIMKDTMGVLAKSIGAGRCLVCENENVNNELLKAKEGQLKLTLEEAVTERDRIKHCLTTPFSAAIQYRKSLKEKIRKLKLLKQKVKNYSEMEDQLHHLQNAVTQIQNLTNKKTQLEAKIGLALSSIEQSKKSLESLEKLKTPKVLKKEDREKLSQLIEKYTPKVELIRNRVSFLNGKLSSMEELLKQRKRILLANRDRQILRDKLATLRAQFHRSVIPNSILNHVIQAWSQKTNSILGSLNAPFIISDVLEDKTLLVKTKDGETFVDSYLSGGQKVVLSIALHLAEIYLLGGKSSSLILDEPTVFLDEENRRNLCELMVSLKDKAMPQLIVTTHDSIIEDCADYTIRLSDMRSNEDVSSIDNCSD